MKNKTLIIITFIVFVCLPLKALAAEMNFPAGSLIIPMDSSYQSDDDGGILEAYGLVFYLLSHLDSEDENDITVYWSINQEKTTINGVDFQIEDTTLSSPNAAVEVYDHDGTTSTLTYKTGDTFDKVTYLGAPFIIDAADAAKAKSIIDTITWAAVDVHEALVPFAAPIHREMIGTPPKIALLNNSENWTGGNALILESYLRLAGICSDVYDVVSPYQVMDGILTTGQDGVLTTGDEYDFLWAPHWTGYGNYKNDTRTPSGDWNSPDATGNGVDDVEDIIIKIREFLDEGKALFGECASIEVFEHSENGRFLTDLSFGHNEGTNDEDDIIYNDLHTAYAQVGDFNFDPEGGHLHNWRPHVTGDKYSLSPEPDESGFPPSLVTAGSPSVYNSTVKRFVIDNTGWDYYVGGYLDGDTSKGYVVYLGGHKYGSCGNSTLSSRMETTTAHEINFEFEKDIDDEILTLVVEYDDGSKAWITVDAADIKAGLPTPAVSTFNLDDPIYQWTQSADTDEYYLEKAGGGNPLIIEPSNVIMDGTTTLTRNPRALGQIVANEWDW